MPKMKSNSGAKKRFSITGKLKKNRKNNSVTVVGNQAGKQHGMTKRSQRQIREHRGTTTMSSGDSIIIARLLPYLKKKK